MDSGYGIGGYEKSQQEMISSKLNFWEPVIIEKGVSRSYDLELFPLSSNSDGPYEFFHQADSKKFIDMSTLNFHARMGVEVANSKGIFENISNKTEEWGEWGLINNFYQSLFTSVIIKLNDTEIGDLAYNSYPYTTYLQTLLGTSFSLSKNHVLGPRGFLKDDVGHVKSPGGEAFKSRSKSIVENALTDFVIPIHNDVCNIEKYLPPNVKIGITMRRTDDDFVLWTSAEKSNKFRIILKDIHLKVKVLEVYDDVLNHFYSEMKRNSEMHIKYTKNVMKSFTVPTGSIELRHHNLFFGSDLPNRIYVIMVEQESFNGSMQKNPFYLESSNMREASLTINSRDEPSPPYKLTPKIDEKELYYALLANTGRDSFDNDSVDISLEEFMKGFFVLAFDRSPIKDNGFYNYPNQPGQITVNIKCHKAIEKNMMVICLASYNNKLTFKDDTVLSQPLL